MQMLICVRCVNVYVFNSFNNRVGSPKISSIILSLSEVQRTENSGFTAEILILWQNWLSDWIRTVFGSLNIVAGRIV